MHATLQEQAYEALRLAEVNPAKSAALAGAIAGRARKNGDPAPLSIAERALGVAALQLEDPEAALRHLRAAIRAGRRAGAADLVAEAQLRLAFVLVVCGHGRRALREVESALAGTGDGVARARAQAQRAVILNQLGRLDEALPDYHAALSVLRRADDHVSVQRILSNRAVRPGLARRGTAAVGHRGPPRRDVRGAHRAAHHGRAPGRPGSHRPARPRRRAPG